MADKTLSIPAAGGGLIRYYEESKSRIRIKPQYVIVAIALTIAFEIVLRIVL